jgi:hypothetical protein
MARTMRITNDATRVALSTYSSRLQTSRRLAVHRHVGSPVLRVGDGGFDLGLGIFGDIHGIEVRTHVNMEGELVLTGAANQVFARHMIITNR